MDEECHAVIQENWRESGSEARPIHTFPHKLGHCQEGLTRWSMQKFGNREERLKRKTKLLEVLQQNEGPVNQQEIKELHVEIDSILEQGDVKWKQRAKQNWYQNGD